MKRLRCGRRANSPWEGRWWRRAREMGNRSQVEGTMVPGDPTWKFGLVEPSRLTGHVLSARNGL